MRRFYYIKPHIQNKFTIGFSILVATEMLFFGIVLLIIEQINIHQSEDLVIYIRFSAMLLIILSISAINFWIGMRISHRFVGPITRILQIIDQALQGDKQARVNMRSSDYLNEIGEKLNILLAKLRHSQSVDSKNNGDKYKIVFENSTSSKRHYIKNNDVT